MGVVVPAILPTSRRDLEDRLSRIVGLVDRVQIDVVDGRFAQPATWPYAGESETFAKEVDSGDTLLHLGQFRYEIDLMVSNPEEVAGIWIAAGANRITVHAESTRYLPQLIERFKTEFGYDKDFAPGLLSLGLALNIESEISLIEPYFDSIDYIQLMGIAHIGRQGEPFDERVIRKVAQIKKTHAHIPVQVDGGVSITNAPALLSAGVSSLVVGSDIWHASDPAEELLRFEELGEQYGIYH